MRCSFEQATGGTRRVRILNKAGLAQLQSDAFVKHRSRVRPPEPALLTVFEFYVFGSTSSAGVEDSNPCVGFSWFNEFLLGGEPSCALWLFAACGQSFPRPISR